MTTIRSALAGDALHLYKLANVLRSFGGLRARPSPGFGVPIGCRNKPWVVQTRSRLTRRRSTVMDWTGGCLCGAVRYRASAPPQYASYCHCGMCRKSSGAPFTGFVEFPQDALQWTKGQATTYLSSDGVVRDFCGRCGSPLTFQADEVLFVTLGSLDTPDRVTFTCHTYTKERLPGMDLADGLPEFPGPVGGKGGRPVD